MNRPLRVSCAHKRDGGDSTSPKTQAFKPGGLGVLQEHEQDWRYTVKIKRPRITLAALSVLCAGIGVIFLYIFSIDVISSSGLSNSNAPHDDGGAMLFGVVWLAASFLVALLAQILIASPQGSEIGRPFGRERVVQLSLLILGTSAVGWLLPYWALGYTLEEELHIVSQRRLALGALPLLYTGAGLLSLALSLVLTIRTILRYNKSRSSEARSWSTGTSSAVLDRLIPTFNMNGWWSAGGLLLDGSLVIVYCRPHDEQVYGRVVQPTEYAGGAAQVSPERVAHIVEDMIRNPMGQAHTKAWSVASHLVDAHEAIMWF
jgi:hypothetical protein